MYPYIYVCVCVHMWVCVYVCSFCKVMSLFACGSYIVHLFACIGHISSCHLYRKTQISADRQTLTFIYRHKHTTLSLHTQTYTSPIRIHASLCYLSSNTDKLEGDYISTKHTHTHTHKEMIH